MIDELWKDVIWRQFGAAMDMFGNALSNCPEEQWGASMWIDPEMTAGFSEFWYVAYHTLFWLDLYLFGSVEGFEPPAPFTLDELDARGLLPDRRYSRDELQTYLAHCRQKCRLVIENLTDDKARQLCRFSWSKDGLSFAELILDNMRHVQEHGAQLNMFLGQQAGISSDWAAKGKEGNTG